MMMKVEERWGESQDCMYVCVCVASGEQLSANPMLLTRPSAGL